MRLPPLIAFGALPLTVLGALFLGTVLFPARPECHADRIDFVRFGGITYVNYEYLTGYTTEGPDPSILERSWRG
jgi:hypothetical protein